MIFGVFWSTLFCTQGSHLLSRDLLKLCMLLYTRVPNDQWVTQWEGASQKSQIFQPRSISIRVRLGDLAFFYTPLPLASLIKLKALYSTHTHTPYISETDLEFVFAIIIIMYDDDDQY